MVWGLGFQDPGQQETVGGEAGRQHCDVQASKAGHQNVGALAMVLPLT